MKQQTKYPPLQTNFPMPVDIDGLNEEDQARIRAIGLERWLDEQEKKVGKRK